ncbi:MULTISPECIES: MauE/DoxX family redox-associated membrane protein [Bacillus]|nr:hypothetical protein [Bacillus velezensis]QGJ66644.1 hypothetical protein BvL003_18290 [Bacillus velezensis]
MEGKLIELKGNRLRINIKTFLIRKVEHVSIAIISIIMLYSGFMKLFDVYSFIFSLQYYQYIPESMYLIVGFAVPIIEIVIAFLIWVKRFRYFFVIFYKLLITIFLILLMANFGRYFPYGCGCFGNGNAETIGYSTIFREVLFLIPSSLYLILRKY